MNAEIALLGQILTLASDDNVLIEEFGSVVASSPQLAAQVVKVANSSLYGMEGRITRLERAVLILGVRTVASIASSVLVANQTKSIRIGKLTGNELWMHSLEVGCCAQLLCRCLSWPHDSEAYLAGLLHDLGLSLLSTDHGDAYASMLDGLRAREGAESKHITQVEQEQFGEDHGQRLARQARRWGFPPLLCDAFTHHHAPTDAADPAQAVASLVHAAHIVIHDHSEGWSDHARVEEDDSNFLISLGLDGDEIADVQITLAEQIKQLSSTFA